MAPVGEEECLEMRKAVIDLLTHIWGAVNIPYAFYDLK